MFYQTHARIHLKNIRFNLENIRNVIGAGRKILLPVKANAYGHGAVEISQLAERVGIDWLGVATVPEGIQLRKAGIRLPILKLGPAYPEEMEEAIGNNLTLTICDMQNAKALNEAARKNRKIEPIHVKVDTGMGRIGISPEDAPELAGFINRELTFLRFEGIWTHLPVSDEASHSFTQRQLSNFGKIVENVEKRLSGKIELVHAANSGGVLAHPESWLNMVRPGIMAYGYYPSSDVPRKVPLKPGLSFETHISFIKKVTKGTAIGYGRTWVAPEDTWIATFSAGYADGFNRRFSNSGRVLIGGRSFPVVGRVCMDASMANLGPKADARVGDDVILIGRSGDEEITVEEWAKKLDTITYEVTCQIGSRVQRVYDTD